MAAPVLSRRNAAKHSEILNYFALFRAEKQRAVLRRRSACTDRRTAGRVTIYDRAPFRSTQRLCSALGCMLVGGRTNLSSLAADVSTPENNQKSGKYHTNTSKL